MYLEVEIAEIGVCSLTYDEAFMFCLCLNHNGHKNWRIPSSHDIVTEESKKCYRWEHFLGNPVRRATWIHNERHDLSDEGGLDYDTKREVLVVREVV